MQEGRTPSALHRRSSGSQQDPQVPAADPNCTLRTNALIYAGSVAPDRRKLVSCLQGGSPQCPEQQPRSPFAPPGAAIKDTWAPFYVVPLPPKLVFESWWHEGPNNRVNMHITFDTVTRRCLAGTYVSLDMEVTTLSGGAVDEYDLHVAAELRVAGRKVTLRKAVTLATLTWLDQQARAMLVTKYRLEQEISKFRPVVPVPVQYTEARRAELFDLGTHQHLPAGGRINLRSLYNFILDLVEQLKQHRPKLPPLPDAVADRLSAAAETLPGPPDWSPERREFERREAEAARQRDLLEPEPSVDNAWRNDLTNWLESIPLASSCCLRYPSKGTGSGISGPGLMAPGSLGEGKTAGGRDRERGVRIAAGSGGGGSSGAAVGIRAGAGSHGSGHTLRFNYSVINRVTGGAGLGGATGDATSRAVSRMQSRAASPTGSRGSFGGGGAPGGPSMRAGPRHR